MIDAGEFTPAAELPSYRMDGTAYPARLSTTDEQRAEAAKWLGTQALMAGADGARALIHWTRYPATVLEVHGAAEHLTLPTGVESVWATARIVERDEHGHELPRDELSRLARLKSELTAMREHDAGPTE